MKNRTPAHTILIVDDHQGLISLIHLKLQLINMSDDNLSHYHG